MTNYLKKIENSSIVFWNALNGTELIINHYDDKYTFDTIVIDDRCDLDFLQYVLNDLKAEFDF